jgi:hypothetical protein
LKTRSIQTSEHLETPDHREALIATSREAKVSRSRELVTTPNGLWKNFKTKHLSFVNQEPRYLKVLAGRRILGLSSSGNLNNHSTEFEDSHSQCPCGNLPLGKLNKVGWGQSKGS